MKSARERTTSLRKEDHPWTCPEHEAEFRKSNGCEYYEFEHQALPAANLDDVDLCTPFLGKTFRLPFMIGAMTLPRPALDSRAAVMETIERLAEERGKTMLMVSATTLDELKGIRIRKAAR
jgi:isopentenyl diphosphate isomerase/L-lactate dehydrogenase-like FMN-dependent dehydrogenase